jgi:glycosyltransferase involved in cell wall biosynthesis
MKICFWGNIGSALRGNTGGGGELQIALLAKALAKEGHEVVVLDYVISEEFQTDDGIKVYPIVGWNKGIRVIRTLTHRLPLLYSNLRDHKADVYYSRIRDFRHIITLWAARKVKAKFILGLAEDLDVMSFKMRWKYYFLTHLHDLWRLSSGILCEIIYPILLRKADMVLVQHEGQRQLLLKQGINSILLPNLIDSTQLPVVSDSGHNYFIFVGWLDEQKGVAELFEVVRRAPLHLFRIIGPPRDKCGFKYYEKLKSLKNVTLLGELNHSDTLSQIAGSKALISTSHMEGFPNIFIEAWAYGIPVLSLYVDPGAVIAQENLGAITNGSIEGLLNSIEKIKNSHEFTERAKAYVDRTHVLNSAKLSEINRMFCDLVNNK